MHPDDKILDLIKIAYYHAPANRSEVVGNVIAENVEYIELITRGGVFHDDGDGEKYYERGTLFWHFPGDETVHKYLQEKPYECFVAIFLMEAPLRRIAKRVTHWTQDSDVLKFADDSLRAFHDETFSREILARSVHARLLTAAYTSEHGTPLPGTPRVLQKALELMDRSYASNLSVDELARQLGVSVPHLHMLFRKYLGESPHRRLTARRLQEAKNRLAGTNGNLKTLAFECGFQNVEHFCRLFKGRFGMTPSEFRLKSRPF